MTNYNERLDDVLYTLVENAADSDSRLGYVEAYEHADQAKQAILDWHNKQVEAKLAHISEYAENVISIDENGEFNMKAIPLSLVAVERNKLNEEVK